MDRICRIRKGNFIPQAREHEGNEARAWEHRSPDRLYIFTTEYTERHGKSIFTTEGAEDTEEKL